ncbi:hypothetical protein HN451_06515 [archaeon]|nr:hypothetical protein [archaeon]
MSSFKYNRPDRCNKISSHYWAKPILDEYFDKNNAKLVNKVKDADLFLPCGYNFTNSDLQNVGVTTKNQYVFGIHNEDEIVSKSSIWTHVVAKYGRDKASKIMPETWVLANKDDVDMLLRDFDPTNKYIMKNVEQGKKGLKMTQNLTDLVRGHSQNYLVAQIYIKNIFCINKKKLNLRFYLLIICKNGNKDFYLYDNGICIYTLKDYNTESNDMEENITSYKFDGKIYDVNPLTLDDFKKYLKSNNKDDKLIMKNIYKIVKMITNSVSFKICNFQNIDKSTSFELFGGDIIFDDKLTPYVLELNKGPDMKPDNYDDPRYAKVKKELFRDIFGIIGLKKSGVKNRFHKL